MKEKVFDINAEIKDFTYRSDSYEIKFLNHAESTGTVSGWNDNFCITYVHSGIFLFDLFRHNYNLHTGCILLDKPQCDFRILPSTGQCTIIRFYPKFYTTLLQDEMYKNLFFLSNENLLSLSLKSNPAIDFIHYNIYQNRHSIQKLEMDLLVVEFLNHVMAIINNNRYDKEDVFALNKYHFPAIEMAKEYMCKNLSENISLNEIATYACISPFHFSRIFKQFTSFAPYQYLLNLRLAKGEHLLKNGKMPVNKIAQLSGFKTPEYFATSFKQKFDKNPSEYRRWLNL